MTHKIAPTPGVKIDPKRNAWRSTIHLPNGNRFTVGFYPTKEQAIDARAKALARRYPAN